MDNLQTSKMAEPAITISAPKSVAQYYDLIVFCHLRWDFVYQRPQHIISRLAKEYKVLFIEEPVAFSPGEENSANLIIIHEQLHILQPKVATIEDIAAIWKHFVSNHVIPIAWFYSPAFVPLMSYIDMTTVVYDCMDELSLFKGAPQSLIEQEKYLLANSDIVFTGGKSLYESKKEMHHNVHCFMSSVDQDHFAKALNGIALPDDISAIPTPIIGYFGVIDERLDLDLLKNTAMMNPDYSFVMIGPLAKINDEDLPKNDNIHYLGMKSYTELPGYLKAFDIAMMPFALNDATKYISPTKTLEYMAAGKPIISTRITDVVRDYSYDVEFVDTPEEFSQAITNWNGKTSTAKKADYSEILARTSWDVTADAMKQLIKKFVI